MPEEKGSPIPINYVEQLLETYPEPISQKELADRSGVTEGAVSQVIKKAKGRLPEICDPKYAFDGLVLREDGQTVSTLFIRFLFANRLSKFIFSKYIRHLIVKAKIHEQLCAGLPHYSEYFRKEDTDLILQTIMVRLTAFDQIEKLSKRIVSSNPKEIAVKMLQDRAESIDAVFKSLNLEIQNEQELNAWLRIRDSAFNWILSVIFDALPNLEIIKTVKEKDMFLNVYRQTAYFYLNQAFSNATRYLKEVSHKGGIRFKPENEAIHVTPNLIQVLGSS